MHSLEIDGVFALDRTSNTGTALETVLDCIFDGVYIVDPARTVLFWNRGAEQITGYTAQEIEGRKCFDGLLNHIDEHGNILCQGKCPILRALNSGQHVRAKIYPMHKSGKRFPVMTHIAPIHDHTGAVVAAIEVFRDISEHEEFRILQEKFRATIKRYVSTQTFEEVMEQVHSGSEGQARIRDLTILYLDVVGFSAYSEENPPEKIADMLNNIFGICEVITRESHGDIDKFIGDAMMATFVDANDAILAAVHILEALAKLNQMRQNNQEEPVHVRIGINSGNVIQGDIGTIERKDRTVIGDTVNTASRIQSLAAPDSIIISESTHLRLNSENQQHFVYDSNVAVKGKRLPVAIYRYTTTT